MVDVKISVPKEHIFHIKVQCNYEDYLLSLKDYLSAYVDNYEFMPSFREGTWNGQISFFKYGRFPYGLLPDFLLHKKKWPEVNLLVDDSVKNIFTPVKKIKLKYDLYYKPWDYQKECIEAAFRYTKMIVRVATGGGKSLIISSIADNLDAIVKKQLIVVPTIQLVEQFYHPSLS
jgi:hypothetical protein